MYDIVQNPIPKSGFFATPTLEALQARIEGLPSAERALVYAYVMQTLNACNQLVEDKILSKEIFAQ
jgi:hypothetical protein